MAPPEKTFVLKHVFKNIQEMKEGERYYSDEDEHFGVPWRIHTIHKDNHFGIFFACLWESEEKWSIQNERDIKLLSVNGQSMVQSADSSFGNMEADSLGWGWSAFIKWDELMNNFVSDDSVIVESNKAFSDVVLIAEDQKFYVLKLYLASQSTYFEALFLRNFEESKKSEIEIKDVKSEDFQKFLELLYGESSIDESTIEGILRLSDMYDAKLAIRKCEEFLMENSEKTLKEKLKLAYYFNLKNLKNKCLSEITTASDIRSVLSNDPSGMDPTLMWELLQKLSASKS
ncbi:hypothetical protein B9Z55_007084 [Caenorhabditis nigoni]|uniref:BTB domain-containing protein n=1 Tax=Caenorhabditis nigoni TaxID=1611254 RepID=A0A2G5V7Z0_9PELO|nr:hypothetical protein B9Z55_007084 [Caenorhabditis nigoni]